MNLLRWRLKRYPVEEETEGGKRLFPPHLDGYAVAVAPVPVGVVEMGRLPFALALLRLLFAGTAIGASPSETSVSRPCLVCPQAKMVNEDLQAQYEKVWKQFTADVDQATQSLETEIATRFSEAQKAGHLDLALMWDGMKKQFGQLSELRWDSAKEKKTWKQRFGDADFPDDLSALLKRCDQDYKTARERLEGGYKNIESALTKAGNLEQALRVRAELKAVLAGEPAPQAVAMAPPEEQAPLAPPNLVPYRDRVGKTLMFRVTATTQGYVWGGTDELYTDDSSLAKAVVHAGVIPAGSTGIVTVRIAPGQKAYPGSTRNGVTSRAWGQHEGSYRIVAGRVVVPQAQPLRKQTVTFAFTPNELKNAFTFHGDCIVNDRNEIECRGKGSRAVTRGVFSIPLRAEFGVCAIKDNAMDIFPGVLTDAEGGGGVQLLWGHNWNAGTAVSVARNVLDRPAHTKIVGDQQYKVIIDINSENKCTISRDGQVVHAFALPINAPRTGHIVCDGANGHVAYRSLTVTTEEPPQPVPALPPRPQTPLLERMAGRWNRDDATEYVLKTDGTVEQWGKKEKRIANQGRCQLGADGTAEVLWSTGHRWQCRFAGDDWIAIHETHNGNAVGDGIVLERIK